jgi:acyl dehydratase
MTLTRTIAAFNTVTASDNKIHDDDTAARFGFTGGLVPGVDVFAYLAHAPRALWGADWLTSGAMRARFAKPVYDGDAATLTAAEAGQSGLKLSVHARGVLCAEGEAQREATGAAPAIAPAAVRVRYAERPAASRETLPVGRALGAITETYFAEIGRRHLADTREDASLYDDGRIANPGFLLRLANSVLACNVKLGPWIRVESAVRLHGLLTEGDQFQTRAIVAENEEKNGHLIVALDFTVHARDGLIMSGRHWAIYEPRQVREKGKAA